MKSLNVRHKTIYLYNGPVVFGEHRAMMRPLDSHDLRLRHFHVTTSPASDLRWVHDVFSNSIALMRFESESDRLVVEARFDVLRTTADEEEKLQFPIAEYAQYFPFSYAADELPDLALSIQRHAVDGNGVVDDWARRFAPGGDVIETWSVLTSINSAIHTGFDYIRREEPGVQSPQDTLGMRSGSCRDFALLMMEAVRALGFAARFVSGYIYDPALVEGDAAMQGSGATHAWVQVYIPGAGWVEFDPTNGLVASANLIRTAVGRTPEQAVPLAGTFSGGSDAFVEMQVEVDVRRGDV